MIKSILLVLFYLITPAIVLRICHVSKLINKLGAVLVCYVIGLVVSQTGIIDHNIKNIPLMISNFAVPLGLPMLLFSTDVRIFKKIGGKALLSMVIALVALTCVVIVGNYMFRDKLDESWKISGMLFGLNSGGTPNVAAIKTALNADDSMFIYINTVDTVLSGAYMLFLISVAKPFFLLFLKDYPYKKTDVVIDEQEKLKFKDWILRIPPVDILKTLGIGLVTAGISAAIGFQITDETIRMTVIILLITTLGVLCSFIPRVKSIKGSYDVGMYIILVFSVAVASMADFTQLKSSSYYLPLYMAFVMYTTFVLHVIFAKIFKIDTDTLMVTSVALICSPPFVPVVAAAIKNREVMISGIAVGIIGYIIGNYMGISIAYLLR